MKKFIAIAIVSALAGCSAYTPDPGHEVVLVQKPVFFGHGGVDPTPISTGRTYAAMTTQGVDVNMQPIRYTIDINDAMTKEGVPIDFHTSMTLQVTDSVRLIRDFGPKWYDNNLYASFLTFVRQAVRKHGMNETAISSEAIDSIDSEITSNLEQFVKDKSIPVKFLTVTVGKANPPDAVKDQRIATAAQEQRIQTEAKRKLAEDGRLSAEQSRAAADNAYREEMHLSPEQFLQLEAIKMQAEVCGHTGKAQCTFIQNGAQPVYNLSK